RDEGTLAAPALPLKITALALQFARKERYLGWVRNVISPGPACSMGATPEISTFPSPTTSPPTSWASSESVLVMVTCLGELFLPWLCRPCDRCRCPERGS